MNERNYQMEEEIDLYDLLEILLRQKIIIVITILLCTILSLGAAFYVRSKNYIKEGVNFTLKTGDYKESYNFKKANLGIKFPDYRDVLTSENNIKDILNIPAVKKYYDEKVPLEQRNSINRDKFIEEILKVEPVLEDDLLESNKKNFRYYKAIAALAGDKAGERELLEKYIELLNLEIEKSIIDAIEKKQKEINTQFKTAQLEVEKLEETLREKFDQESKNFNGKEEALLSMINLKYSKLIGDKNSALAIYQKYREEAAGVSELLANQEEYKNSVKLMSSFYEIKTKSKAIIVLIGGIFFGVFAGIFMAFLKEFLDEFQRRKEMKQKKLAI
jgi:capsular polysaccharide biosynthesis protein